MEDVGLDISKAVRRQLTRDSLNQYDVVVSMAEEEVAPKWLLESPNYIYWDIKDPRGKNFEITAKTRDEIKTRVIELINHNNLNPVIK